MVKTILVGPDIRFGEIILRALDAAGFPVSVAMWLLQKERTERWYLVLATPLYDRLGSHEAYERLIDVLPPDVKGAIDDIRLEGNQRPIIKELRKIFAKTSSVEGMRLGGQSIGGVWVDDAYIYRIR